MEGIPINAKEDFAFRQVVEKCNNALADNAILIIEVNELRSELKKAFNDISSLKFELRKFTDTIPETSDEDMSVLDCVIQEEEKEKEQDLKARKIPKPVVPKSVKTSRVKRKK